MRELKRLICSNTMAEKTPSRAVGAENSLDWVFLGLYQDLKITSRPKQKGLYKRELEVF